MYLFLFLLDLFSAFEYDSRNPFGRSYKDLLKTSQRVENMRFVGKGMIKRKLKMITTHTLNSVSKAPLLFLFGKSSMNWFINTLCDVRLLYSTVITSSSTSWSSSTISSRLDSCVEILLWNCIAISLSSTSSFFECLFIQLKPMCQMYYL